MRPTWTEVCGAGMYVEARTRRYGSQIGHEEHHGIILRSGGVRGVTVTSEAPEAPEAPGRRQSDWLCQAEAAPWQHHARPPHPPAAAPLWDVGIREGTAAKTPINYYSSVHSYVLRASKIYRLLEIAHISTTAVNKSSRVRLAGVWSGWCLSLSVSLARPRDRRSTCVSVSRLSCVCAVTLRLRSLWILYINNDSGKTVVAGRDSDTHTVRG